MRRFFDSLFPHANAVKSSIATINDLRTRFENAPDAELRELCNASNDLHEVIAITAVVARRELGLNFFDVQLHGALSLANGNIAEMQTGEGKTLAAVPAVIWHARSQRGVHVMTVNDYLARRDSIWMGGIYQRLGFSVGCIAQGMTPEERREAYSCDVTYATANETGFDYLRDCIALRTEDQVHRPFAAALIDEADSILIDEARIPLVIAGGEGDQDNLPARADRAVLRLERGWHYTTDDHARNVALTDAGIQTVEIALNIGNLYQPENLSLLTAVQDALHAHALLRRDVDYIVKNGVIESVDEFKGRIAQDRRWPAGLHTAIEVKEGVAVKSQGRILGSITLQNLIALYPFVCGMTGTAATQAKELYQIYGLDVEAIPTNKAVIRTDYPDHVLQTLREKEQAVLQEVRTIHATGRPVLVGTGSVAESERLSALLREIPHVVLNARHEEHEAMAISQAGQRGAVTISTNMAGRGTDISLGEGVAELGGLHVLGTNRHESRRIDFQLRGRAGRQGDPGSSRFIVSLEDDIVIRFGDDIERLKHTPESVQRIVEGKNLEIRLFLQKYEGTLEGQRQIIQRERDKFLLSDTDELERIASLRAIDNLWADHLACITELRSGVQWVAWGGRDPLHEFLRQIDTLFRELMNSLESEIQRSVVEARDLGLDPSERGSTWTYLTTDNPFGNLTDRIRKAIERKLRS